MEAIVVSAPIYYKGMVIQPVRGMFAVYSRNDTKGSDTEYFQYLEESLAYADMASRS